MSFSEQIQGNNRTLRAVAIFYGSDSNQNIGNAVSNNTTAIVTMVDESVDLANILGGIYPPYVQIDEANVQISPKYFSALKSFPSIKESINIETKKYSISSIKLSLLNIRLEDGYLSDLLDSDYFRINKSVEIRYYPNWKHNTYHVAYKGKIKYTSHNKDSISIDLEDATQDSLYKEVPVKYTPDDESMLPKSRNKPYPMVYGSMRKSPILYLSNKDYDDNDFAIDSKFYFDSPDSVLKGNSYIKSELINNANINASYNKVYGTNLYIGDDGSYMNIARYSKTIGNAPDSGDQDNFITGNNTDPFIKLNSEAYQVGVESEGVNDVKSLVLRGYIIKDPIGLDFSSSKIGDDNNGNNHSSFAIISNNDSVSPDELVHGSGAYLVEEVNSQIPEILSGNKYIALCHESGERLDSIMRLNSGGDNNTFETYSFRFRYAESTFSYACDTYLLASLNFNASGYNIDDSIQPFPTHWWANHYIDIFLSENEPTIGYIPPVPVPYITSIGSLVKWGHFVQGTPLGEPYGNAGVFEENTSGGMFIFDSGAVDPIIWNTLDLEVLESNLETYNGDSANQGKAKSDTWTSLNQYNLLNVNIVAQDLAWHPNVPQNSFIVLHWRKYIANGFRIFQNAYIDVFWTKDYYADINGREGGFVGNSTTAEAIIRDIISTELDSPEVINDNNPVGISGVKYAFTQDKKINSKKLIEELSSFSNLFPIFKENKLYIKSIETSYINPSTKTINIKDIVSSSFKRTDVRELYSGIVFNYNYDYSSKSYLSSLTINAGDILDDYDPSFYNLNGAIKTLDCRFINDDVSAHTIASYLLMTNCNPHNNIEISLPLSYIDYELGNIITLSGLINNQKIYGEDYSNGSYFVNGQMKYPFFIISSIAKGNKNVKINLYQLHDLNIEQIQQSDITQVFFCPIQTNQMANENVLGLDDWVDWETGSSMVNSYPDGIFPNPTTGEYIQYVPSQNYCLGEDVPDIIYGCTDPNAINYDPEATDNNGSCEYMAQVPLLSTFTGKGDFFNFYSSEIDNFNYKSNIFFQFEQSYSEVLDELGGESYPLYNPIFYTPEQLHNRLKTIEFGIAGWDSYKRSVNMFILLPDPFNDYGNVNELNGSYAWDYIGWYIKTQGELYTEFTNTTLNMIFTFETILNAINEGDHILAESQIPNSTDDGIYRVSVIPFNDKWVLKIKIPLVYGGDYLDGNFIPTLSVPHLRYGKSLPPNATPTTPEGEFDTYYNIFPDKTEAGMYSNLSDFNIGHIYPTTGQFLFGTLFNGCIDNYFTHDSVGFNSIVPIDDEPDNDYVTTLALTSDFSNYPLDSHPFNEYSSLSGDFYDFLDHRNKTTDFFLSVGTANSDIDLRLSDGVYKLDCTLSEQFDRDLKTNNMFAEETSVNTFWDAVYDDWGVLLKSVDDLRDYLSSLDASGSPFVTMPLQVTLLRVKNLSVIEEENYNYKFSDYEGVETKLIDDGTYSDTSTAGETRITHLIPIQDLSSLYQSENIYDDFRRKLSFEFSPTSGDDSGYYFLRIRRGSGFGELSTRYKSSNLSGGLYVNAIIVGGYYASYMTMDTGNTNYSQYDSPILNDAPYISAIRPFHTLRIHTHKNNNNTSNDLHFRIQKYEEAEDTYVEEEEYVNNEVGIYVYNNINPTGKEFSLIGNPNNELHLRNVDGEFIPTSLDTTDYDTSEELTDKMQELGVGLNIKMRDED